MRHISIRFALLALIPCILITAGSPAAGATSRTGAHKTIRYSHPPAMSVSKNKRYVATVVTNDGTFSIELLPRLAPETVNSFVFLARHHFYDNVQFHRIIRDFMLQTGDPTGTGEGGPGYEFNDEINRSYHLRYYPGTVAMANHGPNTNGSQFFIVTGNAGLTLKNNYTIFGFVSHGWKVIQKIAGTPVGKNFVTSEISQPLVKIYMKRVTIQVLPALHRTPPKPPKH
ncbi:MAG: hypothetical protein NVS2B16_18400 [Chloroflexota bacterium]